MYGIKLWSPLGKDISHCLMDYQSIESIHCFIHHQIFMQHCNQLYSLDRLKWVTLSTLWWNIYKLEGLEGIQSYYHPTNCNIKLINETLTFVNIFNTKIATHISHKEKDMCVCGWQLLQGSFSLYFFSLY